MHLSGGADTRLRFASRLLLRACQLGALFTLCSHAVVAAGGNLFWLLLVFALACAASVFFSRRIRGSTPDAPAVPDAHDSAKSRERPWLRVAGAGVGIAAVLLFHAGDAPIVLWLGGVAALLIGVASAFRIPAPTAATLPRAGSGGPLLAIGLVCAAFALVAHRPDAGDALIANLAATAESRMDLPLLSSDTLHGRDDLPLHDSLYRVQSYELLVGAIAWLTRIPPLYVLHVPIAALAGFLVPLAHAELLRRLTPRHWLVSTGIAMVVLICAGETERWYGNAAFMRIWQGDALFLFVLAPLLYVYAMRFGETGRGLLPLFCAQLSAIGCSAHALWIAPMLVTAGLLSTVPGSSAGAGRLLRGLTPSLYGVGVAFLLGVSPGLAGAAGTTLEAGARLHATLDQVLGGDALALVCLAATFSAWACCPPGAGRRLAVAAPLVLLLGWLNPWLAEWIHENVAAADYALALVALPIPILVTLVIVAPLQYAERLPRHAGLAATAALCAIFVLALPARWGLSPDNGVALDRPGLKVPGEAHQWATTLNEYAAGRRVVAPPDVSTWIPTFRDAAHPLMVQPYLEAQRGRVGSTAYRDRYVMTHYAGGELRHPEAPALFARGLELYGVAAACIRVSEHSETTRDILRRAGYQRRLQSLEYEIWVRS